MKEKARANGNSQGRKKRSMDPNQNPQLRKSQDNMFGLLSHNQQGPGDGCSSSQGRLDTSLTRRGGSTMSEATNLVDRSVVSSMSSNLSPQLTNVAAISGLCPTNQIQQNPGIGQSMNGINGLVTTTTKVGKKPQHLVFSPLAPRSVA